MTTDTTTLSQLKSHLWEASNIFAGPVNAADFKTYVFSLPFFKNASNVNEEYTRFPQNNRFHDPEESSPGILRLRELHTAMDRAVLDAYGWTDIPTDCAFILDYEDDEEDESDGKGRKRKKPWRYRWPDPIRDEVLARLLALNAQRAEDERLAGASNKGLSQAQKPQGRTRKQRKDGIAEPHLELGL